MEKLQLILSDFQGPLDLLLHLIKQSKINIYDIPIADVTQQYLDYLHQMNFLQLDIAGDYLIMASTLMKIKSQLLLPRAPKVDSKSELEDSEDPRTDLVAQLLTYQAFKSITHSLRKLEQQRQQLHSKSPTISKHTDSVTLKPGIIIASDLALVVNELSQTALTRKQNLALVEEDEISISQAQTKIIDQLNQHQPLTFGELLSYQYSVEEVITKFMALLELIKDQVIIVQQTSYQTDIIVKLR